MRRQLNSITARAGPSACVAIPLSQSEVLGRMAVPHRTVNYPWNPKILRAELPLRYECSFRMEDAMPGNAAAYLGTRPSTFILHFPRA
jgi:hypothetical protein